jgi:capsule polysaccharide modification protein KpsS
MEKARCIITYGSTIGIEALYSKKPTISLSKSEYSFANELMQPTSLEELRIFLTNPLTPVSRRGAEFFGNYNYSHGHKFHFYKPTSRLKGNFLGKVFF